MVNADPTALPMRPVATGLRFPESPVALRDGSVLLVEIRRGTLSRVAPDGVVSVVAELGGGPNGAAVGPDGDGNVCVATPGTGADSHTAFVTSSGRGTLYTLDWPGPGLDLAFAP